MSIRYLAIAGHEVCGGFRTIAGAKAWAARKHPGKPVRVIEIELMPGCTPSSRMLRRDVEDDNGEC